MNKTEKFTKKIIDALYILKQTEQGKESFTLDISSDDISYEIHFIPKKIVRVESE